MSAALKRPRPGDADMVARAAYVMHHLERAGATLLALRQRGPALGMRVGALAPVAEWHGYGAAPASTAWPVPSAAEITAMDHALNWLTLFTPDQAGLKRVVGLRLLIHPVTGRHLHSWRAIGRRMGADYRAVQVWHARGIAHLAKFIFSP